jgi:hypothetical protein
MSAVQHPAAQTTWGSPVSLAGFTPAGREAAREARPLGRASRPT